ncbi:MAG: HAMP domain-containing histidine kinase [Planctomycetes bacterium]|nr:HAMP domain-containing histidine kinase [Planctomycetota bacterium]
MTLRHRLLLVYLIVVLLSAATVGTAVFELQHARQIMHDLQAWNRLVLEVEKLNSRWPPPPDLPLDMYDLRDELARQFLFLAPAPDDEAEDEDSRPVRTIPPGLADSVRGLLNEVYRQYGRWLELSPEERSNEPDLVGRGLRRLQLTLEYELGQIELQASIQEVRTHITLVIVGFLILFHIVTIGSLLRRWLLRPMERLNRQVEALARDEPPAEPLLDSPREMAALATAMDRARQSLRAMRQQLLDSDRLTTIGQMAAQLAHNLRNPLASIRAAAQVTLRQDAASEALRQRMSDIIASVDRLNRWVVGLMEIARRDPTLTREVDVVPAVRQAVDAVMQEAAAKELVLVVDAPAEGLVCAHDPATLEHALVAMLVNAVEASPLGGTMRVSVTATDAANDDVCRIAVSDSGIGLPADDPERIFEFSYSTKQRGLGLGLALARQALMRQGGTIHAENNPVGGAIVCIELPRHRDRPSAAETGGAPREPSVVTSQTPRS